MRKKKDTQIDLAVEAKGPGWAVPVAGKKVLQTLASSATMSGGNVATVTNSIDVLPYRQIHLYVFHTSHDTGNVAQLSIIPEVNAGEDPKDEYWCPYSTNDGSITVNTNRDAYPSVGTVAFQPLDILTPATANNETMPTQITLSVESARSFRVKVADVGSPSAASDVTIYYSLSS